ncbi:Kef-type K+ transport system membrane component KefB [Dysgonomonas sp. PFB1-18]|uniref:cation:proton antiporter domain-containing protein n=1 Tax=unclassified Dysgonomonas TaxID=2630389 RepID=UPI002475301F|nr:MULTISPECIES: cation:proton antiporter [unclassified Dysgonomonas]MDL2303006.1 cation:proton antiporter [Dysgonomonas sp. OttesenSCG-928-D17]MDH6309576.1 Kef-type K+ transport system membrane component KefB [Dysgonomonas sp. PF1-14]MDH6339096.1 Kef-type K+ transport system membrane component KefB [Dysgonomonas sp. PF1-16]MDH6380618.1 Kef-type K+ transport system membrane component KefB [Dysgonomonas sp. PFB1-18]MDH6398114.1 Kef-type K+ transport system membrane component KefB [Dysgonomonas 
MKKYKNLIFYISIIGIFVALVYLMLRLGRLNLEAQLNVYGLAPKSTAWKDFLRHLTDDLAAPMAILLLQIVVILLAVRIFGWICQKIGQPTVVGEILAGVVLGPSLLGLYFPQVSHFLFPESSLDTIRFLSHIGLILFMFIVGMELNLKTIKNKANDALLISHTSIAVCFALGVAIAYYLFGKFTHETTIFLPFALFMGIAMSIAAFPVMARIIHEKEINKTPLGATIITCAAIDDITAWCLLAAVIAIVKAGSFVSSLFIILLAVVYVVFMFRVVRPFLKKIADMQSSNRVISRSAIGIFFLILFLSAYATEVIGIHALFGAFLAGVIMPPNVNFRNLFTEKIEDVSLVLLLPLFFVYTGLRTHIGLLNEPGLWMICGAIVFLAIMGKSMGSALAARFVGNSWKDSLTIGALMNTRGLMELVVLNIGLDLGILTPEVFAMMVVMALTTTFMTSPLLNLIDKVFKRKQKNPEVKEEKKYKVLVSFENSEMGRKLLFVANSFIRKKQTGSELTMLHPSEGNLLYQYGIEEEEKDLFRPVWEEAHSLQQNFIPMFKVVGDVSTGVVKIANKGDYDLLLIGYKDSLFSDNVFGRFLGFSNRLIHIPNYFLTKFGNQKKWSRMLMAPLDESTRTIVSKSDMQVGIFIDKGLVSMRNIFIPVFDEDDIFVGDFMQRLAENSYVRITLWDAIGLMDTSMEFIKSVREIKAINPYLFQLWNNNIPVDSDILKKQDLIMISLNSWIELEDRNPKLMKDAPSTLVLTD